MRTFYLIIPVECAQHCKGRFLEVLSIENSIGLPEMITSCNAWAIVADSPEEKTGTLCSEMDLPYLILDMGNIDVALDTLIDQQADADFLRLKIV